MSRFDEPGEPAFNLAAMRPDRMQPMAYVMRDHPGWDWVYGTWLRATDTSHGMIVVPAARAPEPDLGMDVFTLASRLPATVPVALAKALEGIGPVGRWANPSLWDAIVTAIIRQVIRADQARLQHARFRLTHGPAVHIPRGVVHALPSPETVAALQPRDFQRIGMAFKATLLHHAATAYLEHHAKWAELTPGRLVQELQTVPRIGPWTAGAAVADFTHDWSLYPYADLAVRTWARTAAPDVDWPRTEPAFAKHWRAITGDQLGTITLFTLAWGARHADQPGTNASP